MTGRILKSGTALTLSLALALPTMPLAQTGVQGADVPPCETPGGKLWADVVGPQDYSKGPGYKAPVDALAATLGAGAALGAGQGVCVVDLPDARFFAAGKRDASGRVMVAKRDIVAAAQRAGLEVGGRQEQEQAQAEPDAKPRQETGEDAAAQPGLVQQLQGTAEALLQPQAAQQEGGQQQATQQQGGQQPQDARQQAQQTLQEQAHDRLQEQAQQQRDRQQQIQQGLQEQAQQQLDALKGQLRGRQQAQGAGTGQEADGTAQEQQEVSQEDTAASTEAANQSVEAEAAAGGGADEVTTETETVTEADTRSSSEDFATSVTGKVRKGARQQLRQGGGDDGIGDIGKFALGALGALAVGQILGNGDKVVANSGDRVVVQRDDGEYEVLKDDDTLLRRPGTKVTTERFSDGSTRETMTRRNGAKVVTVKAADGQVLRRTRILPDGREVVLFDDTRRVQPVDVSDLPRGRERTVELDATDPDELRRALAAAEARDVGRRFSLQQIRQIRAVRELVPVIELDAITFDTDSAAIRPSEADELRDLGVAMQRMIERNPYEVFLVEGHTDAVGSASYNLALSDRRAESVALALTEYFDVPPENMVVQGYGESNLKVRTPGPERENRRATVRRITPLLYSDAR